MKQEDKELLMKDLCGRLPYGTTIVYCQNEIDWFEEEIGVGVISACINDEYVVKPYLFPMSSLNDKQLNEIRDYRNSIEGRLVGMQGRTIHLIDWLNEHHFDYRGLIEKGLAIDATNLNVY